MSVRAGSIPSTADSKPGTSLYHTCRLVLDKLVLVEGISSCLDAEIPPLNKLWDLCRKGYPLATLFNSLNPAEPLKCNETNQVNEAKKIVYHFIVACQSQLLFKSEDLFTLSDLYQDNTNGFIKVVNTINLILNLLEEKGIISYSSTNRNSFIQPKDTRDKVVNELLETERRYVQDLEVLQSYMRELQIQEILNPDTIHYLFGNLNTLVDFQRRFLIQLEEMGEKSSEEQDFGGLFKLQEQQFTVYEPYCSNYFSAQDLVVQETPKLQKLADILNPVYELPSMLIKPVQRICKYPLLLQQLMKSTNSDWPHVKELEQGLDAVKRVAERVNETQRKYENVQVVRELKKKMMEFKSIQIEHYGPLLLHEKLWLRHEDTTFEKEMIIYFFERTLLVCKHDKDNKAITIKKKRNSLQPKGLIIMNRVVSVRNISTGESNWCLRVDWRDTEVTFIILRFRNEELLKLWESTFKKKMNPQKSNVSNTQLASMKNTTLPHHLSSSLRTDDDDDDDDDEQGDCFTEEPLSFEHSSHRLRSNSTSTQTTRPKIPRNMSADQYTVNKRIIPRSNSSSNIHYYPMSPPPSIPSSPTTPRNKPISPLVENFIFSDDEQTPSYMRNRSQSNPNIPHPCEPPSPLESPNSIKVKLNYNEGIYVILSHTDVGYNELMEKVDRKIKLVSNLLPQDKIRLKYLDEDGDLITINSNDDVQMAFESKCNLNTINLFVIS